MKVTLSPGTTTTRVGQTVDVTVSFTDDAAVSVETTLDVETVGGSGMAGDGSCSSPLQREPLDASVRAVRRYVLGAAAVGLINAVIVLGILAMVREAEQRTAGEYSYGFFSYAPLSRYEPPSRFPWEYVVPPVVVAVFNGLLAVVLLRRSRNSR